MIVITWNGKTHVYTGWQEWLLLAAALAVFWLLLALIAVVIVGVALTIGVMLLLVVPAVVLVTALKGTMKR